VSVLREPLVHMLMIGAALFVMFDLSGRMGNAERPKIVVTKGQVAAAAAEFTRASQRPPTAEELDRLVAESVRDEVLYREALAQGLDKNDPIIRRRLRQKLEFASADADAHYRALLEKYQVVIER
jgi:hypothetical protein